MLRRAMAEMADTGARAEVSRFIPPGMPRMVQRFQGNSVFHNMPLSISPFYLSKRTRAMSPLASTPEWLPVSYQKMFNTEKNYTKTPLFLLGAAWMADKEEKPTFVPRQPSADLGMVGGYDNIMKEIASIVRYLQDPKTFTKNGVKPPKGIILSGPPGVGKSYLAEAIAGHAGVPIFIISASDLIGRYVGVAEGNLRALFQSAKSLNQPCIILLDEIDSIATKRFDSPSQGSEHYANTVVNQLLTLLAEDHPGIVVIATTNNFNKLDPAVVRPGRFDKRIEVSMPNKMDRERILAVHLGDKMLDGSVSIPLLAELSPGFSGARLASWVNEAAILAAEDGDKSIAAKHFDQAREVAISGSSPRVNPNETQRRNTARHEAGHALVGHLLAKRFYKVSVMKTAGETGNTEFLPEENHNPSKEDLLNEICVRLAGRAAELLYSSPQTGVKSDLDSAKAIALEMVQTEGMGKSLVGTNPGAEVDAILQTQLARAVQILQENKSTYEKLVNALVSEHVLYREDFMSIIEGKNLEPKMISASNSSSIFSFWTKKTGNAEFKLPEKKPFTQPNLKSDAERSTDNTKAEKSPTKPLPFTIEEVAKAINVAPEKIREIRVLESGYEIRFKPSFIDHTHMEEVSTELKKHDVENYYSKYGAHNPELSIYKAGIEDFVKYVKEHQPSSWFKKGK